MSDTQEVRERVVQHHAAIFGIDGQGGLVREMEETKTKVADHDKRLASMSMKWLILVGLVGILGNALGQKLVSLLTLIKFFAP